MATIHSLSTATEILAEIAAEIAEIEAEEVHVETNQGTYGSAEAARKVGCGDPAFANREVYETVGGKRRETGPGAGRAPGYMRQINADYMARLRAEVADLRKTLRQRRQS